MKKSKYHISFQIDSNVFQFQVYLQKSTNDATADQKLSLNIWTNKKWWFSEQKDWQPPARPDIDDDDDGGDDDVGDNDLPPSRKIDGFLQDPMLILRKLRALARVIYLFPHNWRKCRQLQHLDSPIS